MPLLIATVLLALARIVDARAGGGGHFGGGGGGHSGGFGGGGFGGGGFGGHSSGGSLSGSDLAIFLVIIAVVIAIFIINALLEMRRKEIVHRGGTAIDLLAADALADRLRQADPAFDAGRFYGRVSQAFLAIQAAWSAHNLLPIQPFVSDGVFERFGLQVREQQARGFRDRMEQVRISRVLLANVAQGELFEIATLRIDASAIDYTAALADGKFLRGSREPQSFTEYWTFIRRRGAASVAADGLIEGRCPNCGAEIRVNQNAACAHCGALLRSGRYDWVLCEITQASEWRPRNARRIPGYDALRSVDPGLSIDELEDRASVIFWRRAEADRTNSPAALRNVVLDALLDSRTAQRSERGEGEWFGDIGVGSVDTMALTRGADFDRAVVQIAWSGTRFTHVGSRGGETSVIRTMFILARRPGLVSDPDKGITSAHCPNCGAPISSSLSNGCDSCGTVLNDGSAGWVLESIESGASDRVAALLREAKSLSNGMAAADVGAAPPTPSMRGLLIWAIKISAADGEIDAKEQKLIERFAAKAGVRLTEVEPLIAAARADRLDVPVPGDRDEAVVWLTAMIGVALVDGRLTRGEAALLKSIADRAGLGEIDVSLLIKKEQARLFAEARAAIRKTP